MSTAADYTDSARAELKLRTAANRLHELVPQVALARQVREFSSDQRKNLLARHIAPLLPVHSAAAAEQMARADEGYRREQAELESQYRDACAAIAEHEATMATFEAARSLFAHQRDLLRQL